MSLGFGSRVNKEHRVAFSSLQTAWLLSIPLTAGRKRIIIECAWELNDGANTQRFQLSYRYRIFRQGKVVGVHRRLLGQVKLHTRE